jgi:hypothetical protein
MYRSMRTHIYSRLQLPTEQQIRRQVSGYRDGALLGVAHVRDLARTPKEVLEW